MGPRLSGTLLFGPNVVSRVRVQKHVPDSAVLTLPKPVEPGRNCCKLG